MGRRLAALLLLVTATVGPSAAAGERASAPATAPVSTEGDSCRKLPQGKRLRLNLKPNTELVDLISWISAITCKPFIVPGTIPAHGKTVTIIAPQPITTAEAYDLFLAALDSVGLTVYASGGFLRVIETSKVKSAPIPIVIDGQD
jgi:type II secretory pathway component GspD/PulD (secretin)